MLFDLVSKIEKADEVYRSTGESIVSDQVFDSWIEQLRELDPNHPLLLRVANIEINPERKVELPFEMRSMDKLKSISEVRDWCNKYNLGNEDMLVISAKLDGLSFCNLENGDFSATRGDGQIGQFSLNHFRQMNSNFEYKEEEFYTYGEVVISKKKFMDKYASDYSNPRNFVSGLLNRDEPSEALSDTDYIRFGLVGLDDKFRFKSQIYLFLNSHQPVPIPFVSISVGELSEEFLLEQFNKFSSDYIIDGLIIEVDKLTKQNEIGRGSNSNPNYAKAFKHPSFEQVERAEVINIEWNISKYGLLKPVININPVNLDGVMVSNITGNNARFIMEMGIGVGSEILVKRSGMVIPMVVEVLKKVDFIMPDVGVEIAWNENMVELITLEETEEQQIKQAISFFEILSTENLSSGTIRLLWKNGFNSIKSILNCTKEDMIKLEGFGDRKAEIIFDSIRKSTKSVSLSTLQHATGIFQGLGSKKLAKLEHFDTKPSIESVRNIEGFAEVSARVYVENYDRFFEYVTDLNVEIAKKTTPTSTSLMDKVFVFSGIRDKNAEVIIESKGGRISSGISKNTHYLIMKSKGSGSSKEQKALSLGVEILTIEELYIFLEKN